MELSRLMDEISEQLAAAHTRKLCTYRALMEALRPDMDRQVEILPWVVGVRGLAKKRQSGEKSNICGEKAKNAGDFFLIIRGLVDRASIARILDFSWSRDSAGSLSWRT